MDTDTINAAIAAVFEAPNRAQARQARVKAGKLLAQLQADNPRNFRGALESLHISRRSAYHYVAAYRASLPAPDPEAADSVKPLLQWIGSKTRLAKWIISSFPRHKRYVDVFGGSGAIFLLKEPSDFEIYNDANNDLVNVFRALQDNTRRKKLLERIRYTPYALSEFLRAQAVLARRNAGSDDRAWAFLVLHNLGYGAMGASFGRSIVSNQSPKRWHNRKSTIDAFAARFALVQVDCLDCLDCISRYDATDTLFYLDPPYPHHTRVSTTHYLHELDDSAHRQLVKALLTIKGNAVLSGYQSPLYDPLIRAGWVVRSARAYCSARGKTRINGLAGCPAGEEAYRTELLFIKK